MPTSRARRRLPRLLALASLLLVSLVLGALVLVPFSCAPALAVGLGTAGLRPAQADNMLPESSTVPVGSIDAHSFWGLEDIDQELALDALMVDMSEEERLGQLFMLSYGGDTPTPLLYSWIRLRGLGGVKIFGWNAEDTVQIGRASCGERV